MSGAVVVASFAKNKREGLRVALDSFRGTNLVDLRVTVPLAEHSSQPTPTKKGVSLNVELLPQLREALDRAESLAREMGWLE